MCLTDKIDKVEVRALIKYFCNKCMSSEEIYEIYEDFVKTLGDESPSYSLVKKRVAEFRRGRESVADYEQSGCPEETTIDIAGQIGTSFGSVYFILTDILGLSTLR